MLIQGNNIFYKPIQKKKQSGVVSHISVKRKSANY